MKKQLAKYRKGAKMSLVTVQPLTNKDPSGFLALTRNGRGCTRRAENPDGFFAFSGRTPHDSKPGTRGRGITEAGITQTMQGGFRLSSRIGDTKRGQAAFVAWADGRAVSRHVVISGYCGTNMEQAAGRGADPKPLHRRTMRERN